MQPIPQAPEVQDLLGEDPELASYLKEFISKATDPSYEDDFHQALLWVYREMIRLQDERAEIAVAGLSATRLERKEISIERLQKMEEVLKKAKRCASWGKFELFLSGVQLSASLVGTGVAVGASAAAASTGVLEVAALSCVLGGACLFLGNSLDHALGNPLKKAALELFGCQEEGKKEAWVNRIELGAGIFSLLLSLPGNALSLASAPNAFAQTLHYAKAGASVSQGAAHGFSALEKQGKNARDAEFLSLTFSMEKKSDSMKEQMQSLETLLENLQYLREQARQTLNLEQSSVQRIFQE